jgi:flagellin-specific chaperone FliS
MNDSRYEDSEYWAGRANEVVYELMGSLDFQLGRDIASTLSATYTMTIREILRAQIRKEPDILNKLGLLYADLAKGWQEAVSRQAV